MSFFTKSDGTEVQPTDSYEMSGLQPIIPEGTELLCAVAACHWEPEGNYPAKAVIELHVIQPGPFKDYTLRHNLKLFDENQKTRDKALDMLGTYDKLGSGLLFKADKAGKDITFNDALLAKALNGVELNATVGVWEVEGPDDGTTKPKTRTGNWIRAIGPKSKKLQDEDKHIMEQASRQPGSDDDFGDDDMVF